MPANSNRLINALGAGERIALSKLAVSHLEREQRPIRVAVDISIWLFQVQAGRGGKNPEIRTLFYRLIKLLALPIHPLFVYDGSKKPPFKRGKATTSRGGNAPIIQRSKDLINRFRFPWHEAPGEAEAECARLQQAGIVDAVMSDDIDTLMFGSTFMIKSFSKESGTGTTAATHITLYNMSNKYYASNIPFDRPGMILFAMLSGGDYLPSGVPKCGSKLAAEIAKAGFGEDLLKIIESHPSDLDSELNEWRDRLQYELEENESGYFTTKHKAVRIPATFPDRAILEYYAEPVVSAKDEMERLKSRLGEEWDQDIDPMAIRNFAAEHLEWNYRSGARKVIKLLAEPLVSYRLRLKRPVSGLTHGTLAPDCGTPWLQKIHRSRANFGTDGMTELQTDMLPIDVVGIDLLAEIPNPQPASDETGPAGQTVEEDDDGEPAGEVAPPQTPSKTRVTKRFDPLAIEKVWVFETIAKLGVPEIVQTWKDDQAKKAASKDAPKKTTTRRTGPKKKGPIDPRMKQGSILKYGTLTKEKSQLSPPFKTHLLEAATSASGNGKSSSRGTAPFPERIDLERYDLSPSMYSIQDTAAQVSTFSQEVDDLVGTFSNLCTPSPTAASKRRPLVNPLRMRSRTSVLGAGEVESEDFGNSIVDTIVPLPPRRRRLIETGTTALKEKDYEAMRPTSLDQPPPCQENYIRQQVAHELDEVEKAIGSLSLIVPPDCENRQRANPRRSEQHISPKKKTIGSGQSLSPKIQSSSSSESAVLSEIEHDTFSLPLKKKFEDPKESPRSPEKKKGADRKPARKIGHIENVTTSNGFWKVDTPIDPEVTSTATSHAQDGQKDQSKKKRLPRVSILDMI
jgi:Holliday junction resolvase YEN1